eukprot:s4346_g9.t1
MAINMMAVIDMISFCFLIVPSAKCHRSNHLEQHQSIDRYLAQKLNTEASRDIHHMILNFQVPVGMVTAETGMVPGQDAFLPAVRGEDFSSRTWGVKNSEFSALSVASGLSGITLESTAVRRRPNAFNLVFQMRLMANFGKDGAKELKAAWNNAAELIQAYGIGRSEANAALNLLNSIPAEVGDRLAQLVKRHSSFRFLLKHGDNDLLKLMEESVPPVDLSRVSLFRVALNKYQKQA